MLVPGAQTPVQTRTSALYTIKRFSNDGGATGISECYMPVDMDGCMPHGTPLTTQLV